MHSLLSINTGQLNDDFWNAKRLLKILLLGGSRHVLVSLQCTQSIRVARLIRGMRTYVGIEEERVRSPREGFGAHVEVFVVGRERDVAVVLSLEVFLMFSVFTLDLLHPKVASRDCFVPGLTRINLYARVKYHLLAGRQP